MEQEPKRQYFYIPNLKFLQDVWTHPFSIEAFQEAQVLARFAARKEQTSEQDNKGHGGTRTPARRRRMSCSGFRCFCRGTGSPHRAALPSAEHNRHGLYRGATP